jgi:hypothetical protein
VPATGDELLKILVASESEEYEAMSLRDENWIKRPAAFERIRGNFAKDFRAITGWDELLTADQYSEIIAQIRLDRYTISEGILIRVSADAAILTCKVERYEADRHGGHRSIMRVSSTWTRQGDKWVKAFQQSTQMTGSQPYPGQSEETPVAAEADRN